MQGVSTKISAGALAGAVVTILVWVLTAPTIGIEWEIPPEVASAATVIVGAVIAWFVPERAVIDLDR